MLLTNSDLRKKCTGHSPGQSCAESCPLHSAPDTRHCFKFGMLCVTSGRSSSPRDQLNVLTEPGRCQPRPLRWNHNTAQLRRRSQTDLSSNRGNYAHSLSCWVIHSVEQFLKSGSISYQNNDIVTIQRVFILLFFEEFQALTR